MKKILMTAYDINPYKGSESGTGWNFVLQSARFNKVLAITRENNKHHINKYIEQFNIDTLNIEFLYFDLPYYLRFWKKGARGSSIYFYMWQMFMPVFIWKNKIKFDIAHNVNFHADAFPSFLWILGKPLVWGPINHNEPIPKEYIISKKEFVLDRLKWIAKNIIWNIDPFMYLSKKKANIIIGGNSSVQKRLNVKDDKFIQMTQVASTTSEKQKSENDDNQFNVLVVGRFLTIKSIDVAIYAFDIFFNNLKNDEQKNVKLIIVGQGSQEKLLKGIACKVNSKNAIQFIGWVDKNKMNQYYKNAKIFLFPSHEGAGMVVVEALSNSLPIICFDNYGPGEFVNDHCAIKLPYNNYQDSVLDFSNAIMKLYKNKKQLTDMSSASIKVFEDKFTWNNKGLVLKGIYDKL